MEIISDSPKDLQFLNWLESGSNNGRCYDCIKACDCHTLCPKM